MFLRLAATVLMTVLSLPAAAQCVGESYLDLLTPDERAALSAATDDIPFGRGTLWTATRADKQVTVVGTMHIYDPRLELMRATVRDAVQGADLVLLEATAEDQADLQRMMVTNPDFLFITDGPTLPELLDEETWQLVIDAASSRSIPSFMAAKMQPWYLSMVLSIPPCAMQDMVRGDMGLDHMIMQDAAAADVPMQALESMMTLFEIFQNDPIEEQIDMLRVNMLAPDIQQQMFVAMLDRYFAGDIATLWEMSRLALTKAPGIDQAQAEELFAETESALLVDRNRNWMPVIAEATAQHDRVVVAVGAAHLIGQEGILTFLQDDGWTIAPIE